MDDEWISAADAYELVRKVNPSRAAEVICSRAHDGLIAAKAHTLIVGEKRNEDAKIPVPFWWAKGNGALNQNWATGDFDTWIRSKVHWRAYGVKFLKRDIVAMLPPSLVTSTVPGQAGEGNFASASQAMAELQNQLKCTSREAASHIIRFCRAGLVESRCATFWYEVTDLFGPSDNELEQVAIPDWFWEHCATGPEAILDWQSGTFAGRGSVGGKKHKVRIRGVEFNIAGLVGLETMLQQQDTADLSVDAATTHTRPDNQPEPVARGGRPKSENWTNWIAELVSYMHQEGIPDGSGVEGQDAVIGAVEERLAERGLDSLSRSTVQAAVRAVLVRLRSAGN
jgi:hypothetical protein